MVGILLSFVVLVTKNLENVSSMWLLCVVAFRVPVSVDFWKNFLKFIKKAQFYTTFFLRLLVFVKTSVLTGKTYFTIKKMLINATIRNL